MPHPQPLAEFATSRIRLLKVAARVTETATRLRIAFAAICPEAELFGSIACSLQPAAPRPMERVLPNSPITAALLRLNT